MTWKLVETLGESGGGSEVLPNAGEAFELWGEERVEFSIECNRSNKWNLGVAGKKKRYPFFILPSPFGYS
jgi:hypothetical protein